MGAGTEKDSRVTGEHGGDPRRDGRGAGLAAGAFAAIKLELGALLVFGALFALAVIHWFDGLEEAVLLGGYGVGAALWVRVRAGGVLLAQRHGRRDGEGQQ